MDDQNRMLTRRLARLRGLDIENERARNQRVWEDLQQQARAGHQQARALQHQQAQAEHNQQQQGMARYGMEDSARSSVHQQLHNQPILSPPQHPYHYQNLHYGGFPIPDMSRQLEEEEQLLDYEENEERMEVSSEAGRRLLDGSIAGDGAEVVSSGWNGFRENSSGTVSRIGMRVYNGPDPPGPLHSTPVDGVDQSIPVHRVNQQMGNMGRQNVRFNLGLNDGRVSADIPLGNGVMPHHYATAYHQNFYYAPPNAPPGVFGVQQPQLLPHHFQAGCAPIPPPGFGHQQPQMFGQGHFPSHLSSVQTRPRPVRVPQEGFDRLNLLLLDKIPDLSGNEGADLIQKFFRKFDLVTEDWPEGKKISSLELKVSGRAERALKSARAKSRRYKEIKQMMLMQLDETDAKKIDSFNTLMSGINRKQGEMLDEFADRILRLVKRAYPGLPDNLVDEYAVQHFIRCINSRELVSNLEMSRKPGQTFDEFVSIASRIESTQKAVGKNQFQPVESRQPIQTSVQSNAKGRNEGFQDQNNGQGGRPMTCYNCGEVGHGSRQCNKPMTCFNCGELGHGSRQCNKPRRENGQASQGQNSLNAGNKSSLVATGANRIEVNKGQQHQQNVRNYLKNNLLTVEQEEEVVRPIVGGIQNAELAKFFNGIVLDEGEKPKRLWKKGLVGKIVLLNVATFGRESKAVVDPGAQISMVKASFLHKLVTEDGLDLKEATYEYSSLGEEVFDVNGNKVGCIGVIRLPLIRDGMPEINVYFHITNAPFGYDYLLGTNSLQDFGFMLYDAAKKEMIEFESVQEPKNAARVVFNTVLKPNSVQFVEIELDRKPEGDVLISSENGGKVRVEPSLVAKNNLVVPVVNLSSFPVELNSDDVIGEAMDVEEVGEADNLLASPLIGFAVESGIGIENSEKEERKEELVDGYWKGKPKERLEMEKALVEELVCDFHDIFALEDIELTQTGLVTHSIDTGSTPPVRSKMRPVPYAYREKVAAMIQDYLSRGIVKPSLSPYASPIVLVPKKDGTLRFCIDYRGLNAVTVKDAYPLPNIDNTLLMLGNKKVFSLVDFFNGYWQIRMDDGSVQKTAFISEHGLFEFLVMPFGLTNAVGTFQRFMSTLFEGMLNDFVFVYVDDVLIASQSVEEHREHLRLVFERIRNAHLKLKIAKCHFSVEEVPFLGHVLTKEGIKMDANRMKPVLDLPMPSTRKQLHSFLGFMTYYRKFIYGFGEVAAPLFRLLQKDVEFKIGKEEMEAFVALKEKIAKDVLLHFPDFLAAQKDPNRQFVVITDASKDGISAVLSQPDSEGRIRPIYFASRQCNKHESRYCPTELEALAVKWGVKKFAQFLTMMPCRVLTDHKALIHMFRSKQETGNYRVDKWIMELNARFSLKVEFQPGKKNIVADLLSRSPAFVNFPCAEEVAEFGRVLNVQMGGEDCFLIEEERREWMELTKNSEFSSLYSFLADRILPDDFNEAQSILDRCPNFAIIQGLLYFCDSKSGDVKLFVPEKFRLKMLEERHAGVCSGHQSGRKLFLQIAQSFFWPNLRADCNNTALNCRICAHSRRPRANQPGLQPVKTAEPFELVCVDLLEIGRSNGNCRYALVMIDHFTKWVVAVAIPDKRAETVAKAIVENLILIFGSPKRLHSDQGKEFVNEILNEIAKILDIGKSTTLGYDPNANGLAERANQTLLGMLRRNTGSVWDWDDRLAYCVFAMNITPSESTGFSPFHLLFGRPVNFPSSETVNLSVNPLYTVDEDNYLQLFRENLAGILNQARENAEKAREKNVNWHDKQANVTLNKYKMGDRVMVVFPGSKRLAEHKKLLWNSFGPYKIVELSNSTAGCVPVDKEKAQPIFVPLERLVRVPAGVPNIATLPKGRNPFKNILGQLRVGKIQGTNLASGAAKTGKAAFDWGMECDGPVHEKCQQLILAKLDPILDGKRGIGSVQATSPLKALFGQFLLKDGTAKTISAGQNLAQMVLRADAGMEFVVFHGARADLVAANKFPDEQDLISVFAIWLEHCTVARELVESLGMGAIEAKKPAAVNALPVADQRAWMDVFKMTGWALEKVRAEHILKAKRIVQFPRVLIGDSTAVQMLTEMGKTELIGGEGAIAGIKDRGEDEGEWPISGVIRTLSSCYLSSRVQAVLVAIGKDSLIKDETVEAILEQCDRLLTMLKPYQHLSIFWMVPVYVHSRASQHLELQRGIQKLLAKSKVCFVMTGQDGRSLAEVFRYANTFNSELINANGWMTQKGLKQVLAWLNTQCAGYPGDLALGIRTVRSEVVVANRGRGPGDPSHRRGGWQRTGPGDRRLVGRVQMSPLRFRRDERSRSPVTRPSSSSRQPLDARLRQFARDRNL